MTAVIRKNEQNDLTEQNDMKGNHMKGKTATTGLLAMGLVIALATLGLVYGNWTQSLSIGGTVNTSSLGASFQDFTTWDSEDDLDLKPVADCGVVLDGKIATITIDGAYPNYWCEITGGVINTGQMPIHVSAGDITVTNQTNDLGAFVEITEIDCDTTKQLMPSTTIDPLDGDSLKCTYRVAIGKGATGAGEVPEKSKLGVSWEITAVQFDKATKDADGGG